MVDKNKLGKGGWTEKTGVGERGRERGGHGRQKLKDVKKWAAGHLEEKHSTGNSNANAQTSVPASVSRIEAATPAATDRMRSDGGWGQKPGLRLQSPKEHREDCGLHPAGVGYHESRVSQQWLHCRVDQGLRCGPVLCTAGRSSTHQTPLAAPSCDNQNVSRIAPG